MNYAWLYLFVSVLQMQVVFGHKEHKKVAVLVVTVGRSGSSCLSGVLEILGVFFGSNLLKKGPHNPKGFFENVMTRLINSLILREVFMSEGRACCIDWDAYPKRTRYTKAIKQHIKKEFAGATLFGIKNLDLAYLLPLYADALHELGYTLKILIALRDPHKVCDSFQTWPESNFNSEMLYMKMAVEFAMILKYVFELDAMTVYYDDLLQDTKKVIDQITAFIPGVRTYEDVQEELSLFIDCSLKHH